MSDRVLVLPVHVEALGRSAKPGTPPAYIETVDGKMPPIRCGQCGMWGASKGAHTVDSDGNVNPSWLHEVPSCGWHVWLRLASWNPSPRTNEKGDA